MEKAYGGVAAAGAGSQGEGIPEEELGRHGVRRTAIIRAIALDTDSNFHQDGYPV